MLQVNRARAHFREMLWDAEGIQGGNEAALTLRTATASPRQEELPANAEGDRQEIRMTVVAEEHTVVASLAVKLHVPL
jgi:hypothetical protein